MSAPAERHFRTGTTTARWVNVNSSPTEAARETRTTTELRRAVRAPAQVRHKHTDIQFHTFWTLMYAMRESK